MQTESFSPKHIWGTDHWSHSVSVADSDTYVAIRIGTAQIEQVARLDVPDTIRLIRNLQAAVDRIAPGAYFPQPTIEDAAEGMIALDRADRRERGENV